MAQDLRDRDKIDAGFNHPRRGRVSEIVHPNPFDIGPPASGLESRLHVLDMGFRFRIEEDVLGRVFRERLQRIINKRVHKDLPGAAALRVGDQDKTLCEVQVGPFEAKDFSPPHSRIESDNQDRPDPRVRAFDQTPGLFRAQDPLAGVGLAEFLNLRRGALFGLPPFDGFPEHRF